MKWFAQAPSNIALIKYMGKKDEQKNIPANSSLSYTLDHLNTFVSLENDVISEDMWEPLIMPATTEFQLDESQQLRFLEHLKFIKKQFKSDEHFIVRSCNNFPANTGLASSASSFAALTICALRALTEIHKTEMPTNDKMAKISQLGSGSSCRSFYKPWALWSGETIKKIDIPYTDLVHMAIIISKDPKTISSSQAHKLVKTSPMFENRISQAESRLTALINTLKDKNWEEAYSLTWQEFTEMHRLFETAETPFTYLTDASKTALNDVKSYWKENKDGPIVTMDAGPNIHLLFRADQESIANELHTHFLKNHDII